GEELRGLLSFRHEAPSALPAFSAQKSGPVTRDGDGGICGVECPLPEGRDGVELDSLRGDSQPGSRRCRGSAGALTQWEGSRDSLGDHGHADPAAAFSAFERERTRAGTARTGHRDTCRSRCVTLPSSRPVTPRWPRAPTTITSASSSFAFL